MKLYVVKDLVAKTVSPPMVHINDDVARREIKSLLIDGAGPINRYPKDYQLVRVGEYDTVSGAIIDDTYQDLETIDLIIKPSVDVVV